MENQQSSQQYVTVKKKTERLSDLQGSRDSTYFIFMIIFLVFFKKILYQIMVVKYSLTLEDNFDIIYGLFAFLFFVKVSPRFNQIRYIYFLNQGNLKIEEIVGLYFMYIVMLAVLIPFFIYFYDVLENLLLINLSLELTPKTIKIVYSMSILALMSKWCYY